jgi:hypothetical protein
VSRPDATGACPRESELLEALERGFVGPDLERHAAECRGCGELSAVATAFLEDRTVAVAEAPVPSSGTMWWRMRIRQRRDAEERARRSLLVGQAVTVTLALGLVAVLFGAEIAAGVRAATAAVRLSTPLLVAAGVLATTLVIAPLAGWLMLRRG